MKIIPNSIQKQVLAVLMGAMICFGITFTSLPTKAEAQSTSAEALMAQIEQLLAVVASLQAQITAMNGGVVDSPTVCPYVWTRSLAVGDTGADVMKLQQFLNSSADTRITTSGDGAPGFETTYYGQATADAVAAFQVKYRSDVLAPVGEVNPSGYFGPATMAKANQVCATYGGPVASSNHVLFHSGRVINAEPGEQVQAMFFETYRQPEDVYVNQVKLFADMANYGEVPWEVFKAAHLYMDDQNIGMLWLNDEASWEERPFGYYEFTAFDGNVRLDKSEAHDFAVYLDLFQDIPGGSFAVGVADEGITTWVESAGHVPYGSYSQNNTIIVGAGAEAGDTAFLEVSSSPDSPDASTLLVDVDDESDQYVVQTVTIEESAGVDVTIDGVSFETSVQGTSAGARSVIAEAMLYHDSVELAATSDTNFIVFENIGLDIGANESEDLELRLVFEPQAEYGEGVTVQTFFNSVDAAVDANGNELTYENMGTTYVDGEKHTLMASGAIVELLDSDVTSLGNFATFELEFEVTAVGGDLSIVSNIDNVKMGDDDTGVLYGFFTGSPSGSYSGTLSSTAEEQGNTYVVEEGDAETFTVEVQFEADNSGSYSVGIVRLAYRLDNGEMQHLDLLGMEDNFFATEIPHIYQIKDIVTDVVQLVGENDQSDDVTEDDLQDAIDDLMDQINNGDDDEEVEEPAEDEIELGTYIGYMNGNRFIRTEDISQADALANCRLNAENNPSRNVVCKWNSVAIYRSSEQTPAEDLTEEPAEDPTEDPGEEEVDDSSYSISDVKKITRRDYYSGEKSKANLSHRMFTIKLKDGTVHKVRRDADMRAQAFEDAVRATGYTGTMRDFHNKKRVLNARVLGASISVDPLSQLSNALYAIEDIVAELQARIK